MIDDEQNDESWHDERETPSDTGWYLCDAVDHRWGPGVFKYRPWRHGLWWIPISGGWLPLPVGTYRWAGPAYDIDGPSPHGDNP